MMVIITYYYNCCPGERVTMLTDDVTAQPQQSACDDVTSSTDQSHAVNVGQCDVTLSATTAPVRSDRVRC